MTDDVDDLRAEAIRQVKRFRKERDITYILRFPGGAAILPSEGIQMARWIIHHHNLTEDDLQ